MKKNKKSIFGYLLKKSSETGMGKLIFRQNKLGLKKGKIELKLKIKLKFFI